MSRQTKHFYEFGDFRVDVAERVLRRDGEVVPLTLKAFEVLLALVERGGQILEKNELMERVWPDSFVEESSLAQNIYTLRKVLGAAPDGQEYIKTVPRRGYRFAVGVVERRLEVEETGTAIEAEALGIAPTPAEESGGRASEEFADHPGVDRESLAIGAHTEDSGDRPTATDNIIQPEQNRRAAIVFAIVLLVAMSIALWFASGFIRREGGREEATEASRRMTITGLTNTGNISCAAISPDGNYVAYGVADSAERSSLWVRQLATHTSQPIIPSAAVRYLSLTFSPDGNYIYYVAVEGEHSRRTLYRVSLLGGASKKLIETIDSPGSFSPDGRQIVFRRGLNDRRATGLFIANADGSGEREIASIKYPEGLRDPAWSPDGKWIACAAGQDAGGKKMYVIAVRTSDGEVTEISARRWRWIGQVAWRRDMSGLMMVASDEPATPFQVWQMDYPGGEARRVTNDSNFYNRLSLSADSSSLVALQRRQVTNVWIIPRADASQARQITFGTGGYRGKLAWTPDGQLVFDSEAGNLAAISIMNGDGSQPRQLLGDQTGRAYVGNATVSPDGKYILYASDLTGTFHIWRMNIDGSNPVQLTNGDGENQPHCSPDGRTVVYVRTGSDRGTLWRVSINGGTPEPLQPADGTLSDSTHPVVSPDGKLIACIYQPDVTLRAPSQIAVFSFDGGAPVKIFPPPASGVSLIRWTPDGRSLTYADSRTGAATLWLQPLDGGAPKQLAAFEKDQVFGFDWSRDGHHLALVRGLWAMDVVLIKDFK